ncbi:serine hydrolase domain-containing protein [Aquiflexum sp.]|uniref:serine hydrolase domain-containing protein n=1 Tax=Aquiflexum sp. TaxID=1872584 RepID=UPI003593D042
MEIRDISHKIQEHFSRQIKKDTNLNNAFLLVHSQKAGLHLNIGSGHRQTEINTQQPQYMASVGKLFTSTMISIFQEKGYLNFQDKIAGYLESDIMDRLHVFKDTDYSGEIRISHLLNQTSGLYDCFWPLLQNLMNDPNFKICPKDAIQWGKGNLSPKFKPGTKHYYSDTNYYLLGLILESVSKKPFHELLHQYIFDPLKMDSAYVLGYSKPKVQPDYSLAGFYVENKDISQLENYPGIDYSGGGVVATMEDLLIFMKALVNNKLIKNHTLTMMMEDRKSLNLSINYGYGIWMFKKIPLLLPRSMYCWGCVGATGAFMFYHPNSESFIIGNFNNLAYRTKAIQFMLFKVVKELVKIKN